MAFRKVVDITHERTLKGAILPPKASHTHSLISVTFDKEDHLIEFAGITSSILLDGFIKLLSAKNITSSRLGFFPFGIKEQYKSALFSRVLMLNCVNSWYADLWARNFQDNFKEQTWSKIDHRLKDFKTLTSKWGSHCFLKTEFERRQALLEIDVIVALAFNLTFEEFMSIYEIYFPITQKYDPETWYDKNGLIVFTPKDYELDVDRNTWERIALEAKESLSKGMNYRYNHVIEKSELYQGKEISFEAPYTNCDRVADYRHAWSHFSQIFNK